MADETPLSALEELLEASDDDDNAAEASTDPQDIIKQQKQTIVSLQKQVEAANEYKQVTNTRLKQAAQRLKEYRTKVEDLQKQLEKAKKAANSASRSPKPKPTASSATQTLLEGSLALPLQFVKPQTSASVQTDLLESMPTDKKRKRSVDDMFTSNKEATTETAPSVPTTYPSPSVHHQTDFMSQMSKEIDDELGSSSDSDSDASSTAPATDPSAKSEHPEQRKEEIKSSSSEYEDDSFALSIEDDLFSTVQTQTQPEAMQIDKEGKDEKAETEEINEKEVMKKEEEDGEVGETTAVIRENNTASPTLEQSKSTPTNYQPPAQTEQCRPMKFKASARRQPTDMKNYKYVGRTISILLYHHISCPASDTYHADTLIPSLMSNYKTSNLSLSDILQGVVHLFYNPASWHHANFSTISLFVSSLLSSFDTYDVSTRIFTFFRPYIFPTTSVVVPSDVINAKESIALMLSVIMNTSADKYALLQLLLVDIIKTYPNELGPYFIQQLFHTSCVDIRTTCRNDTSSLMETIVHTVVVLGSTFVNEANWRAVMDVAKYLADWNLPIDRTNFDTLALVHSYLDNYVDKLLTCPFDFDMQTSLQLIGCGYEEVLFGHFVSRFNTLLSSDAWKETSSSHQVALLHTLAPIIQSRYSKVGTEGVSQPFQDLCNTIQSQLEQLIAKVDVNDSLDCIASLLSLNALQVPIAWIDNQQVDHLLSKDVDADKLRAVRMRMRVRKQEKSG